MVFVPRDLIAARRVCGTIHRTDVWLVDDVQRRGIDIHVRE